MHDPRVGRFFAVDPLTHQYPWYTPYQFSGNKVIAYGELEGLEEAYRVVPLQTDKPVFTSDSNISVLDRVGNAFTNSVNFLANNTAGIAINASADVADVIVGNKTIRLHEDVLYPVRDFFHEREKINERRTYSEMVDNAIETFTTLENYGLPFQFFLARRFGKPSTSSLSTTAELSQPVVDLRSVALAENTVTYGSSKFSILGGLGELSINARKMEGYLYVEGKKVLIEGEINITGKNIDFNKVAIYAEENFDTVGAQNSIGPKPFISLIEDLSKVVKDAGYESGSLEFYRRRPEGSKLTNSEIRTIPLSLNK